jgi:hypothetical protein
MNVIKNILHMFALFVPMENFSKEVCGVSDGWDMYGQRLFWNTKG